MNIPSLIRSSTDPESVSLFVKSIVALAILFGVDTTIVNEAGGFLSNLIVGIGMVATAITGIWGLFRKMNLGRWSAPSYRED